MKKAAIGLAPFSAIRNLPGTRRADRVDVRGHPAQRAQIEKERQHGLASKEKAARLTRRPIGAVSFVRDQPQDSGRKSYRCRSFFRVVLIAYWMRSISPPSRVKT
jgi:hypothetical protein